MNVDIDRDIRIARQLGIAHVPCSAAFREWWFADYYSERRVARYLEEKRPGRDPHEAPPRKKPLFVGTGVIKKIARIRVYEFVRRVGEMDPADPWASNLAPRVLCLAGGEPEHEIELARATFQNAEVVAADLDDRAIHRARKFADLAIHYDVGDLRLRGQWETPRAIAAPYAFANLDFCGLVTSAGIGPAIERAGHVARYVATWFSFGHEQCMPQITTLSNLIGTGANELDDLPDTVRKRLLFIWHRIRHSNPSPSVVGRVAMRAIKVWTYRDQKMPMMIVLWGSRDLFNQSAVQYEKITTTLADFRALTLGAADAHGADYAARYFGVTRSQIAAWRAVRTRSTKAAT